MPDFAYLALARTGKRSEGTISAASDRDAASKLDAQGLFPLKVSPIKAASAKRFGGKVGGRVMAGFYSQLADLLRSGVPLLRSLDLLERQNSNKTLSEAVREVRAKVADGSPIYEAMKAYPRVFDELSVSMVRAGQEGGFLEDVLKRIADFTEKQEDLKSKVVGAMAYPAFLAVVGSIILLALIVFFVPQFEPIFAKLKEKGELPSLTVALLGTSDFLIRYGVFLLGFLVFGIVMFRRWLKTDAGRLKADRFRLKIPVAGQLFLSFSLSRFTRILGTLLKNGIPMLDSLRIAKDSTGNKVLSEAIEKSAENVTAGNKLAQPLAECAYFPRDVVEMIAIAEESNSLENVLVDISESLEKKTGRQLELFVRLLEPVMLLVMAVITLLVVAGLLLPVFKMSSTVK